MDDDAYRAFVHASGVKWKGLGPWYPFGGNILFHMGDIWLLIALICFITAGVIARKLYQLYHGKFGQQ